MDLFATLLATSGLSATYLVSRARRDKRQRARLLRLGRMQPEEMPLDTRHLSAKLAGLCAGARTLRLILETPLRRLGDVMALQGTWLLRERFVEYDLALAEARLALWHWLLAVARLDASDIAVLRQLGLDPRPLRALVYKPGILDRGDRVFESPLFPALPDADRLADELASAMALLLRFEVALLSHRGAPYR